MTSRLSRPPTPPLPHKEAMSNPYSELPKTAKTCLKCFLYFEHFGTAGCPVCVETS